MASAFTSPIPVSVVNSSIVAVFMFIKLLLLSLLFIQALFSIYGQLQIHTSCLNFSSTSSVLYIIIVISSLTILAIFILLVSAPSFRPPARVMTSFTLELLSTSYTPGLFIIPLISTVTLVVGILSFDSSFSSFLSSLKISMTSSLLFWLFLYMTKMVPPSKRVIIVNINIVFFKLPPSLFYLIYNSLL